MALMINAETALIYLGILDDISFDMLGILDEIEAADGAPVEWPYLNRKTDLERMTRLVFSLQLQLAVYPLSIAASVTLDEPICP